LPVLGPQCGILLHGRGVAAAKSSYILRGPSRKGPESAVDEGQQSHKPLFLKGLLRRGASRWKRLAALAIAPLESSGYPGCDGLVDGGRSSAGRAPGCDPGCRGFESHRPPHLSSDGPLAQLVEQETLNLLVVGSTPTRPTKFKDLRTEYAGSCVSWSPFTAGVCVRWIGAMGANYRLAWGPLERFRGLLLAMTPR